ncbi:MAG: DUF389 domain-containing protein [Acidimicrobiales bacterium]
MSTPKADRPTTHHHSPTTRPTTSHVTPPPSNPSRRRLGPSLTERAIGRLARRYLHNNRMAREERARVVANLFHEGGRRTPFVHRFGALMILSSLIAVLGLLADSTAVVIGAMIVAPLMAPVLGVAAAIVMDWPRRAAESALTAGLGSLMAIALAVAASLVLPTPEEIPGEVLARTAPNLLDLGVAVAAGAAGAYAQVRRAAGEALTGVAVAVALVPPLAVVGITLQMGEWTLAAGAFLLYLANVAGIVLSAAGTFMLCGLAPRKQLISGRFHVARGLRLAVAAVLLIVAPLELTDQWRERRPINDDETRDAVKDVMEQTNPDAAVIAIEVDTEDGERTIDITASTTDEPIDVTHLAEDLSEELDVGFELEVTTLEADSQSATVEESKDGEADIAVDDEPEESSDGADTETTEDADDNQSDG